MLMTATRTSARKRTRKGFTLIEVMISIFLTLLLIVGINQAFKVVSSTVGAGQAMATSTRDSFSAQLAFQQELGHTIVHDNDTPFLIIDSQVQQAFLNKQDMDADRDGLASTIDLDNNNVEGEDTVPGEDMQWFRQNNRVHRIDSLGFFSTDAYRRQTGNSSDGNYVPKVPATENPNDPYDPALGAFAAAQSSRQAYVWFGHLWLPGSVKGPNADKQDQLPWYVDNATDQMPSYPGEGTAATNPKNYFATDWILGRMAILLTEGYKRPEVPLDTPMTYAELGATPDWNTAEGATALDRPAPAPVDQTTGGTNNLGQPSSHGNLLTAIDRPVFIAPPDYNLAPSVKRTDPPTSYLPIARVQNQKRLPSGRYVAYPVDQVPGAASWDARFSSVADGRYDIAVGSMRIFKSILRQAMDNANQWNTSQSELYSFRWWESLCYRFKGDTSVGKPMNPDSVARSQQVFLRHCTQFIVEYAGDFVEQDNKVYDEANQTLANANYGNVRDFYFNTADSLDHTDKITDYYVDKSRDPNANSATAADPKLWVRRIRWYGFPRDINGDGKIQGYREQTTGVGAVTNNEMQDVVPLRDVILSGRTPTVTPVAQKLWAGKTWQSALVANPTPIPNWSGAPFEKDLEADTAHPALLSSPGRNGGNGDYARAGAISPFSRYTCAFGPVGSPTNQHGGGLRKFAPPSNAENQAPIVNDDALLRIRMLRIIITLDDANNRLPEGQTFQYIIALP
jgi:prepilin-type N-terminal cleavage/methylation domain-containing protein